MDEFEKIKGEATREEERDERKIYSSDELLEKEFPKATFLVDTLIPQGGITAIAGDPNSFKSWVMLYIAKQIVAGNTLWVDEYGDGFKTLETNILWVDEEVNAREIKRRWKKLQPQEELPIYFMAQEGFKLDHSYDRKWLLSQLAEKDIGLVIFDSLRAIHNKNENDSKEAQYILDCLHEFTTQGISVLCSHHKKKKSDFITSSVGQLLRGSTAFWAGFNSILAISSERKSHFVNDITCAHIKLKEGAKAQSFKLQFVEEEREIDIKWLKGISEKTLEEEKIERAVKEFLTKQKKLSYAKELKGLLSKEKDLSERSVERSLSKLRKEKKLIGIPEDKEKAIKKEQGLHPATKILKWNR